GLSAINIKRSGKNQHQPAGAREGELERQVDSHHRGKENDRYRQDQRYEELLPEIPVMMVAFISPAIMLVRTVIIMTVMIMMTMVMLWHDSYLFSNCIIPSVTVPLRLPIYGARLHLRSRYLYNSPCRQSYLRLNRL